MVIQHILIKNNSRWVGILLNKALMLGVATLLVACQSSAPQKTHTTTLHPKHRQQPPTMQMRKSSDGVQDIAWQIVSIQNKKGLFFNQYPSFTLNAAAKTVSGSTGCNIIYGRYRYEFAQQNIDFDVMVGHDSCPKALAQEADLMDALQRIERFQLDGTNLYLLDKSGRRLIQAQRTP